MITFLCVQGIRCCWGLKAIHEGVVKFTREQRKRYGYGLYGLSAVVAGVAENDMTHFVFIGAPDIPTMMQRMTKLQQDEEFMAFSARVGSIRTILYQI